MQKGGRPVLIAVLCGIAVPPILAHMLAKSGLPPLLSSCHRQSELMEQLNREFEGILGLPAQ
eukprot:scaffold206256_cov18-Tisochrysis_lutea.AAC.2